MRELHGSAGEIVALLLATSGTLRAIHAAGLAHADLTPGNIRVGPDGGVAIESFAAPPPGATLMVTEAKYAAPEMLLGNSTLGAAVHMQSDIYVLGFVAYEALAGAEALRSQIFVQQGETPSDLLWMKWHADMDHRLRPLDEVAPSVPKELSKIIQRMTEKNPAERFCSLEDVEAALRELQRRLESTDDVPLDTLLVSDVSRLEELQPKRVGRSRFLVVLWVVCAVAIVAVSWTLAGSLRSLAGNAFAATARSRSAARLPESVETASGPMVLVPQGAFVMGSSLVANEGPARTVYLPAFYIDKYEVSNARYRVFTDNAGYAQPSAPSWDPDYFAKGSFPVMNVSWRDAQAFCISMGKRLPSEAEWEKTARGASPGSRLWANWTVDGLANLKRIGGSSGPAPVGSFVSDISPFGAYDMAGNVHEWVNDQYGLYSGNSALLEGASTAKVVRGGSFALSRDGLSPSWRASHEASVGPGEDSPIGFRCAADPRSVVDKRGIAISPRYAPSQR
jgi:formylglycine-generating enzyme